MTVTMPDRDRAGIDQVPGEIETVKENEKISPFIEIGETGLKRTAGWIDEEFLPQLRGRKAVQIFREMSDNDPMVNALVFAVEQLVRNVEWHVTPAGKSKEDADAANFVDECMQDMSHSWNDFISEALSCLVYGWSWFEVIYKRRQGLWTQTPGQRSKFTDDRIGWRKMPIRSQESLLRWDFDGRGEVIGMTQMPAPHYQTVTLPLQRSLLFRYRHSKGNPEGTSMLRGAYRPWYMKKRIEEFEAIGVERDLAGMPVAKIPAHLLSSESRKDKELVASMKRLVRSIRRNEQDGLVFPLSYDPDNGNPEYIFELLASSGGKQFNTSEIVKRHNEAILMTVLADFILVGHQNSGSYSLHTDKTGIFRTALNSIAQSIADVLNRHALPRLFALNGWRPDALPAITPQDVDSPDIMQLGQFMNAMTNAGVTWFPDGDLEQFVRQAARLPKLDKDSIELRRQMQMRTEAVQMAAANTEYLQSQQEFMMARVGQLPTDRMQTAIGASREDQQRERDEQAGAENEEKMAAQQAHSEEREDQHRAEDQQMQLHQTKAQLDAKKDAAKGKSKGKAVKTGGKKAKK